MKRVLLGTVYYFVMVVLPLESRAVRLIICQSQTHSSRNSLKWFGLSWSFGSSWKCRVNPHGSPPPFARIRLLCAVVWYGCCRIRREAVYVWLSFEGNWFEGWRDGSVRASGQDLTQIQFPLREKCPAWRLERERGPLSPFKWLQLIVPAIFVHKKFKVHSIVKHRSHFSFILCIIQPYFSVFNFRSEKWAACLPPWWGRHGRGFCCRCWSVLAPCTGGWWECGLPSRKCSSVNRWPSRCAGTWAGTTRWCPTSSITTRRRKPAWRRISSGRWSRWTAARIWRCFSAPCVYRSH